MGYYAGRNQKGSNKLVIENSDTDSTGMLIFGNFEDNLLRLNANVGIGRNGMINKLEVEGNASKTTAGDWLANSDIRIKTNIQDMNDSFEKVLKLRPVAFKYSDDWKEKHPGIEDKIYYNFIAQEYQQVFPDAVQGSGEYITGDPDEMLQIDTYPAQVVTIKAVQDLILQNQEQQKMIEELKQEIAKLKNR
jgi:hypothetical protein